MSFGMWREGKTKEKQLERVSSHKAYHLTDVIIFPIRSHLWFGDSLPYTRIDTLQKRFSGLTIAFIAGIVNFDMVGLSSEHCI